MLQFCYPLLVRIILQNNHKDYIDDLVQDCSNFSALAITAVLHRHILYAA